VETLRPFCLLEKWKNGVRVKIQYFLPFSETDLDWTTAEIRFAYKVQG
jgi:hypothetical protein